MPWQWRHWVLIWNRKNFLTSLAAFLVWGNRKRCMGNLLLAISCFFLFLLLLLLLFFLSCWWPLGLSQTSEMAKQREMKENKQRPTSPSILSIGKGDFRFQNFLLNWVWQNMPFCFPVLCQRPTAVFDMTQAYLIFVLHGQNKFKI